ncbi:phage major capsid protein [Nonomuraea sp. K274]|uniref:Phage major capsid protein n=1 Tax=Nonomuraea cypriaca TaxID=1187855 RepID=A0A931AH94_9ACTN|nr:phage major capsid protein [Nonomuraea cypriaca]MBF8189122.1 phage major capsid protein [Nonomuraea cypriaca]
MTNPYLKKLRGQYDSLKVSMEGLQTRAADEGRDLSEDELRSVKDQSATAKGLAEQIESLTEIENRNRKVAELATAAEGTEQTRALGITATDRDPGHYRKDGGHSFFGDLYRARSLGDDVASDRLTQHNRALSTGTNGPGIVPPKWMTDEFAALPYQGRALANVVRNIPLGSDARPITLPKQTAGTAVGGQVGDAENGAIVSTDAWDSDVDTIVPKAVAGAQLVSRQMLDMSSPAVDILIYGDLLAAYNKEIENKLGVALLGVGTPLTATQAQFIAHASTGGTFAPDLVVRAGVAVRSARHQAANILAMTPDRYGEFLMLKDSTGRPLITDGSEGPMNVVGVGSVNVDGRIKGFGVVVSAGMDDATANQDSFSVFHSPDVLLFESNLLRFRYDEPNGPESVKLGIWRYAAVAVRQGTRAVKNVEIDTTPAG